ncbi:hypothetical protein PBAL39_09631 [Pedobacter sp. BAL39]|uniref:hypothetical protein n=1 Tax=Pedobacter sp. BAL39 TaxID=391596 RepID=UPI0001559EE2|nr:hypothetical protein [Pedobacter sp. BAL39]EDM37394.1 hypothetical protein PBAL39_09631 [Pedobacter sp. BAL39]
MKKIVFVLFFMVLLAMTTTSTVNAQCAMCTVTAEQSVKNGNSQGKGLNTGILYLLAIPYVLITGMGILWYVKFRKKNTGEVLDVQP